MIGKDFVTVTKTEEGDWDVVHKSSSTIIEQHLLKNEVVLVETEGQQEQRKGGDTDIENKIREILDNEVRPAVAMDGGDIQFAGFEDGVVLVQMRGACAGCPSSSMTLKAGIENMLRHYVPEVTEVRAVQ